MKKKKKEKKPSGAMQTLCTTGAAFRVQPKVFAMYEWVKMLSWGGNSSFKTCYGRTKTALVGLLGLVIIVLVGSKTHLIGKN
jgi:hypothetical protein